jgi:excisionase family DNA binding protein
LAVGSCLAVDGGGGCDTPVDTRRYANERRLPYPCTRPQELTERAISDDASRLIIELSGAPYSGWGRFIRYTQGDMQNQTGQNGRNARAVRAVRDIPDGAAPDLLTVEQAARYLHLSTSSIRAYIRQGTLRAFRVAGLRKVLIPRDEPPPCWSRPGPPRAKAKGQERFCRSRRERVKRRPDADPVTALSLQPPDDGSPDKEHLHGR